MTFACGRAGDAKHASAPLEISIDVGSAHPDKIFLQAAMRIDPCADVGLVRAPEHLCGILPAREMKAEPGGGRDADLVARNVAKQDCTCRLAGPNNADVYTAGRKTSPARIVLKDAAAMIVIHVNSFRHRGNSKAAHQCGQERSEYRHSEMSHLANGHGSVRPRGVGCLPHRKLKAIAPCNIILILETPQRHATSLERPSKARDSSFGAGTPRPPIA